MGKIYDEMRKLKQRIDEFYNNPSFQYWLDSKKNVDNFTLEEFEEKFKQYINTLPEESRKNYDFSNDISKFNTITIKLINDPNLSKEDKVALYNDFLSPYSIQTKSESLGVMDKINEQSAAKNIIEIAKAKNPNIKEFEKPDGKKIKIEDLEKELTKQLNGKKFNDLSDIEILNTFTALGINNEIATEYVATKPLDLQRTCFAIEEYRKKLHGDMQFYEMKDGFQLPIDDGIGLYENLNAKLSRDGKKWEDLSLKEKTSMLSNAGVPEDVVGSFLGYELVRENKDIGEITQSHIKNGLNKTINIELLKDIDSTVTQQTIDSIVNTMNAKDFADKTQDDLLNEGQHAKNTQESMKIVFNDSIKAALSGNNNDLKKHIITNVYDKKDVADIVKTIVNDAQLLATPNTRKEFLETLYSYNPEEFKKAGITIDEIENRKVVKEGNIIQKVIGNANINEAIDNPNAISDWLKNAGLSEEVINDLFVKYATEKAVNPVANRLLNNNTQLKEMDSKEMTNYLKDNQVPHDAKIVDAINTYDYDFVGRESNSAIMNKAGIIEKGAASSISSYYIHADEIKKNPDLDRENLYTGKEFYSVIHNDETYYSMPNEKDKLRAFSNTKIKLTQQEKDNIKGLYNLLKEKGYVRKDGEVSLGVFKDFIEKSNAYHNAMENYAKVNKPLPNNAKPEDIQKAQQDKNKAIEDLKKAKDEYTAEYSNMKEIIQYASDHIDPKNGFLPLNFEMSRTDRLPVEIRVNPVPCAFLNSFSVLFNKIEKTGITIDELIEDPTAAMNKAVLEEIKTIDPVELLKKDEATLRANQELTNSDVQSQLFINVIADKHYKEINDIVKSTGQGIVRGVDGIWQMHTKEFKKPEDFTQMNLDYQKYAATVDNPYYIMELSAQNLVSSFNEASIFLLADPNDKVPVENMISSYSFNGETLDIDFKGPKVTPASYLRDKKDVVNFAAINENIDKALKAAVVSDDGVIIANDIKGADLIKNVLSSAMFAVKNTQILRPNEEKRIKDELKILNSKRRRTPEEETRRNYLNTQLKAKAKLDAFMKNPIKKVQDAMEEQGLDEETQKEYTEKANDHIESVNESMSKKGLNNTFEDNIQKFNATQKEVLEDAKDFNKNFEMINKKIESLQAKVNTSDGIIKQQNILALKRYQLKATELQVSYMTKLKEQYEKGIIDDKYYSKRVQGIKDGTYKDIPEEHLGFKIDKFPKNYKDYASENDLSTDTYTTKELKALYEDAKKAAQEEKIERVNRYVAMNGELVGKDYYDNTDNLQIRDGVKQIDVKGQTVTIDNVVSIDKFLEDTIVKLQQQEANKNNPVLEEANVQNQEPVVQANNVEPIINNNQEIINNEINNEIVNNNPNRIQVHIEEAVEIKDDASKSKMINNNELQNNKNLEDIKK